MFLRKQTWFIVVETLLLRCKIGNKSGLFGLGN